MKTLTPIKAGEELFNDYGPLPRSDLLRRYGYITDNYAQYDVVEIPHDLVVSIAAMPGIDTESRIEYLDEQGVIDTGYDISTSSPFDMHDSLSPGLIVLVMTLLMTNTEFNHFKRKEKLPKPEKITLVGINCLLKILKARMHQYPTTLEEDLSTASEATMTGHGTLKERRADMAKSVRVGEKKILQEAQKVLADMVLEMANSNGTSKRQAEDIDSGAGKKQRAR
jgi:SET domain-containing protein 6